MNASHHDLEVSPAPAPLAWWQKPLNSKQTILGIFFCATMVGTGIAVVSLVNKPSTPVPDLNSEVFSPRRSAFIVSNDAFSLIPREEIYSGGPAKDGIPALTNPAVVAASKASDMHAENRVVGLAIGNEMRAYPLRILNWHEIVNDNLGGQSIAVTYCPLCDSVVVFDRNIGGQVREFGVSGLLYNSNVLMYDRQGGDESKESLWSQMMMKAVVGPAAKEGLELSLLPAQLMTWEAWTNLHPDTTVLSFQTGYNRNYADNPYENYFTDSRLMFPVKPIAQAQLDVTLESKEPVILVRMGGKTKGYPISMLRVAANSTSDGVVSDQFAGNDLKFVPMDVEMNHFRVSDASDTPVPTAFSFGFEFQATHPDAEVFRPVLHRD